MRITKKAVSIVLAIMMVAAMMSVMAVTASATGTEISTLDELKNACLNGGEYSMTCDIPFKASFDVKANVIIHGNNHTIYYGDGMASSSNCAFRVFGGASLTIDNATINGESNVGAQAQNAIYTKNATSTRYTINFNNVTVTNFGGYSYAGALNLVGCPDATFTDCTFTNNGSRCTAAADGSSGKDVWVGTGTATYPASLTISGGTYDEIFLNSSASQAASGTLKDGATVKKVYLDTTSGKSSTLDIQDASRVGVLINETVVDQARSSDYDNVCIYDEASLRAALANGGEYIVANNVVCEIDEQLVAAKDITIDFNCKSITENTVYVKTPETNKGGFVFKDGANVVLDNGTLNLNNTYYGLKVEDANLTIGSKLVVNAPEGNMVGTGATLNVDGEINSSNWFAIGTNGSSNAIGSHNYTININSGAKVTSTEATAAGIYHCNDGTLNITGGTITGPTAVIVKSGTTNITGGTLNGNGAATAFNHNGNGAEPTGDAIIVESCDYPGGTPDITITKGTFNSTNAKAVGVYVQNLYEPASGFISGGTYSSVVDVDYIVPGKICYQSGSKFYTKNDDNPLNSLEAVGPVDDGNAFGLTCNYLAGTLLGVQKKSFVTEGTSDQEGENNMRYVACLDTTILKKADDYGFVVAKLNDSKDYSNTNIDALAANWGNGEKTLSAKGTYNNICGNTAYGDPTDSSTDYKYITCAINDVTDSDKFIVRFYVQLDGKYYYAKYTNSANNTYTGCIAAWSDLG